MLLERNDMLISKLTVPEAIKEMVGTTNTFSVGFYKKDGAFRTGVFRLGVKKNQKGGKQYTNPSNYLVAYDMQKKGYRNINYNTIKYIKAKGMIYHIDVENTDDYRLMFVGVVNTKDAD